MAMSDQDKRGGFRSASLPLIGVSNLETLTHVNQSSSVAGTSQPNVASATSSNEADGLFIFQQHTSKGQLPHIPRRRRNPEGARMHTAPFHGRGRSWARCLHTVQTPPPSGCLRATVRKRSASIADRSQPRKPQSSATSQTSATSPFILQQHTSKGQLSRTSRRRRNPQGARMHTAPLHGVKDRTHIVGPLRSRCSSKKIAHIRGTS